MQNTEKVELQPPRAEPEICVTNMESRRDKKFYESCGRFSFSLIGFIKQLKTRKVGQKLFHESIVKLSLRVTTHRLRYQRLVPIRHNRTFSTPTAMHKI